MSIMLELRQDVSTEQQLLMLKTQLEMYLNNLSTGTDGEIAKGDPGTPGAPGKSCYLHIRYSANSSGIPMTENPNSTTNYMGIYSNNSTIASESALDYTWVRVKGDAGADGTDGTNGTDGEDGFSPIATVNKVGKVATISITDKTGTTTATVSDGADGKDGTDGTDGQDGTPGTPGADGISPNLSIGSVTEGATASASITGIFPDLLLNLVMPNGEGADDYIVDAGVSGEWTYVKYNSGRAACHRTIAQGIAVNTTTGTGSNIKRSAGMTTTFPDGLFNATPRPFVEAWHPTIPVAHFCYATTKDMIGYGAMCFTTYSSITINFTLAAVGTWK